MKGISLSRFKAETVAFFTSCLFMVSLDGKGQTTDSSKTYHFFVEVYLFTPSMSGTTGVGALPNTFICAPASELLKHLKFGGMLYAEVHNDHYAFTSDLFYASLAQDASSKNNVVSGTASLKQFLWELAGLYQLKPWLEVGVGASINSISSGLNINVTSGQGTVNRDKSMTETWVDPIIITRLKGQINKKWLLHFRADIGGFGIGSQIGLATAAGYFLPGIQINGIRPRIPLHFHGLPDRH